MTQWFDVDRAGLGGQAEEHGKGRLIGELVQNALDEEGVTQIAVILALAPGRPLVDLTVEDDSPEGFKDLSHAYTLFAESYNRDRDNVKPAYLQAVQVAMLAASSPYTALRSRSVGAGAGLSGVVRA
jgi:hypothetical protein